MKKVFYSRSVATAFFIRRKYYSSRFNILLRGCLVTGGKFWVLTSDVSWDVERDVRILTKKINYITRLETLRRIY
jgi:hypothetical protein